MKIAKNKTTAIIIAIFLTISMSASMLFVPNAIAHTPAWQIPTYAYMSVAPNPVGVNQQVFVIMFLDSTFDPAAALTNNYRFQNYQLTIIPPTGANQIINFPYISDPTSSQDYAFTPTQAGTYTFIFNFPGQSITTSDDSPTSAFINDTYLPSSTNATLTVLSTAIPAALNGAPLPNSFWERPIYGENTQWFAISSNWLGSGAPVEPTVGSGDIGAYGFSAQMQRYPGDAIGPLTSHVMWTKPIQSGGVVGGNNFDVQGDTFFEGSAYDQRFNNPIIMAGILYYQTPLGYSSEGSLAGGSSNGTYAVDLVTGKVLWVSSQIPAGAISFGMILAVHEPNQNGAMLPMLFTSNFAQAWDGDTGALLFSVANVPGGGSFFAAGVPETMGPSGEHIRYIATNLGTAANPKWYLAQWNSSNIWNWNIPTGGGTPLPNTSNFNITAVSPFGGPPTTTQYINTVNGGANSMYDWNISIPGANTYGSFTEIDAVYNNILICMSGSYPGISSTVFYPTSYTPYTYFAIDMNRTHSTFGQVLWTNTVQPPAGNLTVLAGPIDPVAGVFTEGYKETMQWVGYSVATGKQIWGPTSPQAPLDYFGNPISPNVMIQSAYGNIYSMGYGGILYCYSITTGNLLWTYGNGGEGNSTYAGFNTPFGEYPTFINAVGNGVIYLVASEHTINTPIFKGELERAINATNGAEIWTISGYTGEFATMSYAIADGYATYFNGYDNQIYSLGRGPSATSVQAPQTAVTQGNNVVIQGTVMDISAGTKQDQQAADFPNGVPCSSDTSMKDWMAFVYQQQVHPNNFTGVTVSIDAIDPNNNTVHIGTATTNEYGVYDFAWTTPTVPGQYTVYANFDGNLGYYPSSAQTSMYVAAPPTTSSTPTAAPPASNTDTYILGSAVAIILVIIIIGAVIMLALRKRA